jgi:hypothetical protein
MFLFIVIPSIIYFGSAWILSRLLPAEFRFPGQQFKFFAYSITFFMWVVSMFTVDWGTEKGLGNLIAEPLVISVGPLMCFLLRERVTSRCTPIFSKDFADLVLCICVGIVAYIVTVNIPSLGGWS